MDSSRECAIVCPMGFNKPDFISHLLQGDFDAIVACDGGYRHVASVREDGYSLGKITAVGDFDSLGYVPEADVLVQFDSHKDESDFELALRWAKDQGFTKVRAYGALGGRPDHQWAVLAAAVQSAESGVQVTLVGFDPNAECQMCAVPLVGPACLDIPAKPGGIVSAFSFGDACEDVTEEGMEYPLLHAHLSSRSTLGLSNVQLQGPVRLSVGQGSLIVFYEL